MKNRWQGTVVDKTDTRDVLEARGVFDEADAFFDALDRGDDVLTDHHDPHEIVEQVKLRRDG